MTSPRHSHHHPSHPWRTHVSQRSPHRRFPVQSRELDLWLLAGCSCLLTLLHHPVLDQIQTQASHRPAQSSSTPSAVPASQSSSSALGSIQTTLPPNRDRFRIEEDDDA